MVFILILFIYFHFITKRKRMNVFNTTKKGKEF